LQSKDLFSNLGREKKAIGALAPIAVACSAVSERRSRRRRSGFTRPAAAASMRFRCALKNQERESSESPMLKAFWRVAPSVLLSFFAICDALVFLRAIVFSSRSSLEVHARRFFFLFAITPPFQERQLVSLMRAKEKPSVMITFGVRVARARTHCEDRNIHSGIIKQKVLLDH
jgi:hypothetical protein